MCATIAAGRVWAAIATGLVWAAIAAGRVWAAIAAWLVTTKQLRCWEEGFRLLDPFFDAMIKADSAGAVFNDDVSTAAYDEDDARRLKHNEWTLLSGVTVNKTVQFSCDGKTYAAEFWARARAATPNADPEAEPEIEYRASLPTRHPMAIPESLGPQEPLDSKTKSGVHHVGETQRGLQDDDAGAAQAVARAVRLGQVFLPHRAATEVRGAASCHRVASTSSCASIRNTLGSL